MAEIIAFDRARREAPAPVSAEVVRIGLLPLHCEFYAAQPEQPLVVFLPGVATYAALYQEFFRALCAQGFNVVGIDPRGHGHSGGRRGYYTVPQMVDDCRAVIDHFSAEVGGPLVLMGYSIGSPLALAVAEAEPRTRALVCHTLMLGNAPPDLFYLLGWSALDFTNLIAPDLTVNVRSLLDVSKLAASTRYAAWFEADSLLVWDYPVSTLAAVFSWRHRALREQLPFSAVVISGEQDEVIPPDYERRAVENLTHPFDYRVVTGAGHMAPFNRAEELASISARWLRSVLK